MAAQRGEHVYATLLLNDSYLPGALVLAHSLRDARTTKKLAVLVTLDSVSAESITQLKTVYDYIFPVPRIQNGHPANLYLMNRADLHSAFTKINLWKLTEFSKIVYIDADIVAYRAPDELFDIAHPFSAAPDIGWPDLFNTGVMALTPNMGDYYAMMAMANRGISFDGADQGLLNMHFRNDYNRLSFTYNVTPSAHYQYLPAYRHFQSSINMVHFIGPEKPWFSGRNAPHGNSPYDEMVGRWWAVYDRHFRVQERAPEQRRVPEPEDRSHDQVPPVSEYVQYFTKGEFKPQGTTEQERSLGEQHHQGHHDPVYAAGSHPPPSSSYSGSQSIPEHHHYHHSPAPSHEQHGQQYHHHHHHHHHQPEHHQEQHQEYHYEHQHHNDHDQGAPVGTSHPHSAPHVSHSAPSSASVGSHSSGTQAEARSEQQVPEHIHHGGTPPVEQKKPEPPPITMNSWDAQRQPPPSDSKPEAINFPSTHYEMSRDTKHFVPPERYPSPPRNMWYEVPKERPAPRTQAPKTIFPWETNQPKPSRFFADEPPEPEEPPAPVFEEPSTSEPAEESTTVESLTTEVKSEPSTPATPTLKITPADPWTSFTRINAWDEVPEIERYVEGLPWHRRVKSQEKIGRSGGIKSPSSFGKGDGKDRQRSFKLTDFPSELERPSLPVTPAPIRRPAFWGGDDAEHGEEGGPRKLPEAEGVPTQSDWVCVHGRLWGPADCLCELADLVLNSKDPMAQLKKLAEQQSDALLRKLGGDEEEESSGVSREIPSRPLPFGSEDVRSTAYAAQSVPGVLSPQPVKGKVTTSILRSMGGDTVDPITILDPPSIPKPSYSGPGAAWERGEDFLQQETPMPPTEEDRDVLDI